MEEDFAYKDISELKKELEGLKGKKDVSNKELYETVEKLNQTISDMLEVFGAAAEQMKLEEQSYEQSARKHEMIISKLDKLIDQNKTIAEGMVAIVEMVKEKLIAPAKEREELFKQQPEPRLFIRPPKPEWQPKPEPMMPRAQPTMAPPIAPMPMAPPPMPTPSFDLGMQMPPLQPEPAEFPDLGLEEPFPLEEEPKKKGLFGLFKK